MDKNIIIVRILGTKTNNKGGTPKMKNLIGTTILSVNPNTNRRDDDLLYIETDKGTMTFYHAQQWSESV